MEIEMVDLINEDGRRWKRARGEKHDRRLEPHDDLLVMRACERDAEVGVKVDRTKLFGNWLATFQAAGRLALAPLSLVTLTLTVDTTNIFLQF